MFRRGVWMAGGAVVLAAALLWSPRSAGPIGAFGSRSVHPSPPVGSPPSAVDERGPTDEARSHAFRLPDGRTPSLSCEAAKVIVAQVRAQLAYTPDAVDARSFADVAADWLDPYGLWSVAPDTPVAAAFTLRGRELLAEVEGRGSPDCSAARSLGVELQGWVDGLRRVFDRARMENAGGEEALTAASATAFEGATVTRPARVLAATLGKRIGVIERELGPASHPYVDEASARYFPDLDAEGWGRVVLASAVRAYVPSIDPHGAWAPLDEESSVYEVDLEARPPVRLWDKSERTAIGLRIESGAAPPFAEGDVVLSLAGIATAGLSLEQTEQLAFAASDSRPPPSAVVMRKGERLPITTWLDAAPLERKALALGGEDADDLPVERIAYGEGDAVIVSIHDVRDDLGDELTRALLREREKIGRSLVGVILDLRGNGGGSTDGAIDALGLFIPGAPLFPMKRRDGAVETDRAPEPPVVDRWRGPVASLVDGDTASAAEMIAGALAAYRRGPAIGTTTFGKGCAQEYTDDEAQAGVLRLTTLLYALPDGTPVQRVGLVPTMRFPFSTEVNDREVALEHSAPTWRGPDVRDRSITERSEDGTWNAVWPAHGGNVGPCKSAEVCRALRQLGAVSATARRLASPKGR